MKEPTKISDSTPGSSSSDVAITTFLAGSTMFHGWTTYRLLKRVPAPPPWKIAINAGLTMYEGYETMKSTKVFK